MHRKKIRVSVVVTLLLIMLSGFAFSSSNQIDLSKYDFYQINYEDKSFADYLHERLSHFSGILDNTQKQLKSPYLFKTDLLSGKGELSLLTSEEKNQLNQYINIINAFSKQQKKFSSNIIQEFVSVGFYFISSQDSIEVLCAKENSYTNIYSINFIRAEYLNGLFTNINKNYEYISFVYTYSHAAAFLEGYAIAYSDTKQPFIVKLQRKTEPLEYLFVNDNVLVKGGTFQMGDEEWDPVHTVKLTYDFWIGKYEVTFLEYDTFCEAMGRTKPDDRQDWYPGMANPDDLGLGRGPRPVIHVTWWDAVAYCNWLSRKEGLPVAYREEGESEEGSLLDGNGNITTDITIVQGYRLPTEAEWEYAARGGQNTKGYKYAGSNNVNEVACYNDINTRVVGKKKPNELGLYDMTGNVFEWCHDWYDREYYSKSPRTNPIGPDRGEERSTKSNNGANLLYSRVASRSGEWPTNSDSESGFRIARTVF